MRSKTGADAIGPPSGDTPVPGFALAPTDPEVTDTVANRDTDCVAFATDALAFGTVALR